MQTSTTNTLADYAKTRAEFDRVTHEEWARNRGRTVPTRQYAGMHDFIVKHGHLSPSRALAAGELATVKAAWKGAAGRDLDLPKQECFMNAQRLVQNDRSKRLVYVEGLVLRIIPIHHAWVEINGKVVDPTIRWDGDNDKVVEQWPRFRNRVFGIHHTQYFGVPFATSYVMRTCLKRGYLGSLIDDWQRDWPLLTGKDAYVGP